MLHMNDQLQQARELVRLRRSVEALQESLRLLEEERDRLVSQRRRRMLLVGGGLSLVLHICLMIYLAQINRPGHGEGAGSEVSIEFAVLDEEELAGMEPGGFDELEAEETTIEDTVALDVSELSPTAPTVEVASAAAGSVPTLGGSGGGNGDGSGFGEGFGLGGAGGASFFGIAAKGNRIAYIVDVSGSMSQNRKHELAMRELSRSIDTLPDFSHFYVLLFSSGSFPPPQQKGWTPARKSNVRTVITWLKQIDPTGGTEPRNAFLQVFSLEERPDVLYFLTDGQFQDITPDEIAELNRRGKKIVINTIQFGDPDGEEVLREIAKKSGGTYRFIAAELR